MSPCPPSRTRSGVTAALYLGILLAGVLYVRVHAQGAAPPPDEVAIIQKVMGALGMSLSVARVEIVKPQGESLRQHWYAAASPNAVAPPPGKPVFGCQLWLWEREAGAEWQLAGLSQPDGAEVESVELPSGEKATLKVEARKFVDFATGQIVGVFRCGRLIAYISGSLGDPSKPGAVEQVRGEAVKLARQMKEPAVALLTRLSQALMQYGLCHSRQSPLDLLDANPEFTGGVSFLTPLTTADLEKLATASVRRSGAAADGVSILLVRAQMPEKGRVTFRLEGPEAVGGLLSLAEAVPWTGRAGLGGKAVLETPTVEIRRNHYAFAVYAPPKEFGSPGAARLSHRFKVVAALAPDPAAAGTAPKGSPTRAETAVEVVRPPLVLVHGTYDDPVSCWRKLHIVASSPITMYERLTRQEHFQVWTVDFEKSNGSSRTGPSYLRDNQSVVWGNRGGIGDALAHFRGTCNPARCDQPHPIGRPTYAATQAYVVCHSLGGLVTRTYIRGTPLPVDDRSPSAPPPDHFQPNRTRCPSCWYHRTGNFYQGDINRMITISTTHKGSDIPGVIMAFRRVLGSNVGDQVETRVLSLAVDSETGMWTGAFENQVPNNPALNAIGKTPVPAHAIACVADDADLDVFYMRRLMKVWLCSETSALYKGFTDLGQTRDAEELLLLQREYWKPGLVMPALGSVTSLKELLEEPATTPTPRREPTPVGAKLADLWKDPSRVPEFLKHPMIFPCIRLRGAVFGNSPNDCTVRQESSLAGLEYPYSSVAPHVLHGYAPSALSVQERVADLLSGRGDLRFAPLGFPPAGGPVKNLPWQGVRLPGLATPEPRQRPEPVVARKPPIGPAVPPGTLRRAGGPPANSNASTSASGPGGDGPGNSNSNRSSAGRPGEPPPPTFNPPEPYARPQPTPRPVPAVGGNASPPARRSTNTSTNSNSAGALPGTGGTGNSPSNNNRDDSSGAYSRVIEPGGARNGAPGKAPRMARAGASGRAAAPQLRAGPGGTGLPARNEIPGGRSGVAGPLGVALTRANGEVTVGPVPPDSPASQAGLKAGDTIVGVNGKRTRGLTLEQVADLLRGNREGAADLTIARGDQILDVSVPLPAPGGRSGVQVEVRNGETVVTSVRAASPAEAAGLKPGDVLVSVGGKRVESLAPDELSRSLLSPEVLAAGIRVARGDQILTLKLPAVGTPREPGRVEMPPAGAATPALSNLKGFSEQDWFVGTEGKGKGILSDGLLLLTVQPNESGGLRGWSRGALRGDFVLDFHHRIQDWTPEPGDTLSVEFRVAAEARSGAPAIVVRRRVGADGAETFEVTAPGQQRTVTVQGKHVDMALRRRGAEWTLVHFSGMAGGWVPLARLTLDLPEAVYLGVAARKTGASLLQLYLMLGDGRSAMFEP